MCEVCGKRRYEIVHECGKVHLLREHGVGWNSALCLFRDQNPPAQLVPPPSDRQCLDVSKQVWVSHSLDLYVRCEDGQMGGVGHRRVKALASGGIQVLWGLKCKRIWVPSRRKSLQNHKYKMKYFKMRK